MTIRYESEIEDTFAFDPEALGREVILAALKALSFPYEAEVSLTLVSEETIHEMNFRFRQVDQPTDVLSFPLLSFPSPGDFTEIGQDADSVNPDTGDVMLGDIVLSAAHVTSQARAYGHSEKREYAFLILHSMLHLMGYDHETANEEEEMRVLQEKILEQMQIPR